MATRPRGHSGGGVVGPDGGILRRRWVATTVGQRSCSWITWVRASVCQPPRSAGDRMHLGVSDRILGFLSSATAPSEDCGGPARQRPAPSRVILVEARPCESSGRGLYARAPRG